MVQTKRSRGVEERRKSQDDVEIKNECENCHF